MAIITCPPNELMLPIHTRMPVILDPADYDAWMDPANPDPKSLLQPFPAERMRAYPVSSDVGSVKNNRPDLMEPIAQQASLL